MHVKLCYLFPPTLVLKVFKPVGKLKEHTVITSLFKNQNTQVFDFVNMFSAFFPSPLYQSIWGAARRAYHRLGGLRTTKIHFSKFWRLGGPRSRCQQILCLVKTRFLVRACVCVCVCVSCLVVSNSLQPHRLQPTRPLHPWILQARTLEWVAISFSKRSYRKRESEVAQSCPTLCDTMGCSPPCSS